MDDEIEWAKQFARRQVRAAFDDREAILEQVSELLDDEGLTDVLNPNQVVEAEIAALLAEQKTWAEVTDVDRLETVFQAIEAKGVVPRHNFTCCGNCGLAEIGDEITDAMKSGRPVTGFVFYHQQDTERAVDGYGLCFNYGAVGSNASEQDHLAVGKLLASELQKAGLEVDWNGSLSKRIRVKLDWKRRWGAGSDFLQRGERQATLH